MTSDTDLSTASHEAAHAISFIEFGWPFDVVSIEPQDDMLGFVFGDFPTDDPRRALMFLAGPVAEQRFTGIDLDTLFNTGGKADLQSAQAALAQDYVPRSLESAINCTRRLITFKWPQIELIAYHLQQRRSLTYDETLRLVW